MYLLPITRVHLMEFLPKGGEVAEIGVATGDFSRAILDIVKPDRLHLIDPWEFQDREDYIDDPNNVPDAENQARYEAILEMFSGEIASGQVVVHRAYSQDVAPSFADGQFDWVFIDGLHTYEGCRTDLVSYAPKVKPSGFILGHDYSNNEIHRKIQSGVVEAVNEFVLNGDYTFVALTLEAFPSYVLTADTDSPATRLLVANLVYNISGLVRILDYPRRGAFRHEIVPIGGREPHLFTF